MAVSLSSHKGTAAKTRSRLRRQVRGRKKIFGAPERPRLVVSRSAKHITAQVVDDVAGRTLAYASTMEADLRGTTGDKSAKAKQVGALVADRAKAAEPRPKPAAFRPEFTREGLEAATRASAPSVPPTSPSAWTMPARAGARSLVDTLAERLALLSQQMEAHQRELDTRIRCAEAELAALCGKDMVLPMNTGAEAVESGIKVARAWGYRVKGVAPDAANIIVMAGNFHGRTTTIISFSDDPDAHDDFGPYTPGFRMVPYGDAAAVAAFCGCFRAPPRPQPPDTLHHPRTARPPCPSQSLPAPGPAPAPAAGLSRAVTGPHGPHVCHSRYAAFCACTAAHIPR